jgi:hypothetical protein
LTESSLSQSEISAESQSFFLTGNTSYSIGNTPAIISLQSITRRLPFLACEDLIILLVQKKADRIYFEEKTA